MNPTRRFTIADIQRTPQRRIPNFYVIYSVPGWGKTSLGTMFPNAIFMMTRQELGLSKLMENYLVEPTAHFPEMSDWESLQGALDDLIDNPGHGFQTLVVDTMNGAERMMQEHVCTLHFNGDWGDAGFEGYKRGYKACIPEWIMFMNRLERLRQEQGMTIVLLSHAERITFKNPEAADYDMYAPAVHTDIWSITYRAASAVLFGRFKSTVVVGGVVDSNPKKSRKGKAIGSAAGGQQRFLCPVGHPLYYAKNQLGLTKDIDMGEDYREGWENFTTAIKEARKQAQKEMAEAAEQRAAAAAERQAAATANQQTATDNQQDQTSEQTQETK